MNDWRDGPFPGSIRYNGFMTPIGIIDLQLCKKAIGWPKEMHPSPSKATSIPSIGQRSANRVLALNQQTIHIIGLIQDSLTIVGKLRREYICANATAVEIHAITAKRGYIKPRALDHL